MTYRKTFSGTTSTDIAVPVDTYNGPGKAVVFAGNSSKDLLAIGSITAIAPGSSTTIITLDTKTVNFTLTALANNVNKDVTTSTFQIMGPTKAPSFATSAVAGGNTPTLTVNGVNYPVFAVPPPKYANALDDSNQTTDGLPLDSLTSIVGRYTFTCGNNSNFAGVLLNGAWSVTAASYVTGNFAGASGVTTTPKFPAADGTVSTAAPTAGSFYFNIDVSAVPEDGYSALSISVPVWAINGNSGNGGVAATGWTIKGGSDNAKPDGGITPAPGSAGGAVLISVGTPVEMVNIGINVSPVP